MVDDRQELTAEQVQQYLNDNPDFLSIYPNLLETLSLHRSPAGTISLAQRQVEKLQGKNQQLHEQLQALLENAHANSALQDRVHRLCLRLLDSTSFEVLLEDLICELKQGFAADEVSLCLFYSGKTAPPLSKVSANMSQIHADDERLRVFDHLFIKQQPICGRLTRAQSQLLFAENAAAIQSVACLPLGDKPCAGLLAIASHDAHRFHADMGTTYLTFLGEVFMRLLRQYCHDNDHQS